jgi:hypothetical protein
VLLVQQGVHQLRSEADFGRGEEEGALDGFKA